MEQERHTELTTGESHTEDVAVVLERSALAREARRALSDLPQVEDADANLIIGVLTNRMQPVIDREFAHLPSDDRPEEPERKRLARDAAFWIIRKSKDALAELLHAEIASQARIVDALPLPTFMLYPSDMPLEPSKKNIYGALPPTKDSVASLPNAVTIDVRSMLRARTFTFTPEAVGVAEYDGGHAMGQDERDFARALDRADFVHWWHRNPDRKPYSVRLVRGEHKNYFYPDFLVCLEHFPGDEPLIRLVETKESTKDAARKSRHASALYGRVLFLTRDQSVLRWVNEDGTLGNSVDLDDLHAMQEWLRTTRPSALQN